MVQDMSTNFLDNFFEFLPHDMQQEIIKRCYLIHVSEWLCLSRTNHHQQQQQLRHTLGLLVHMY